MIIQKPGKDKKYQLLCIDQECGNIMDMPRGTVYRKPPQIKAIFNGVDPETQQPINHAVDTTQRQRTTVAGMVPSQGIQYLPMPQVVVTNVGLHGMLFPEANGRLMYPCRPCHKWLATAMATKTNIFLKCTNPGCGTVTRFDGTEEYLARTKLPHATRRHAPTTFPPWEACGLSRYNPHNGLLSKHVPALTKPEGDGETTWTLTRARHNT